MAFLRYEIKQTRAPVDLVTCLLTAAIFVAGGGGFVCFGF